MLDTAELVFDTLGIIEEEDVLRNANSVFSATAVVRARRSQQNAAKLVLLY